MVKLFLSGLFLFSVVTNHAQGIKFEEDQNWSDIKTKAKAENKFIFMDCYATWCGPCKFMKDSVFTQDKVGQYMNSRFINVAVQIDQTPKDGKYIRRWYADAKSIVSEYTINVLPTYLFFSPDGILVHRVVGATGKETDNFIAKAQESLDSNEQYYAIVNNYKMHLNNSEYLRNALTMTLNAKDARMSEEIGDAYVNCLGHDFTKPDLWLIRGTIVSSKDKGFILFLNNAKLIDSIVDDLDAVETCIWPIIAKEYIDPLFLEDKFPLDWADVKNDLKNKYPALNNITISLLDHEFEDQILVHEIQEPLYKKNAKDANWQMISNRIKKRYPGYNPDRMIAKEKAKYFSFKKMWRECEESVLSYMDVYGSQASNTERNSFAWDYAFMHSTNRKFLLAALKWSKQTIPDLSDSSVYSRNTTYEFMDTYANLLYKLGYRSKAIFWENKALELAHNASEEQSYQSNLSITLSRMRKGQDTWTGRSGRYEEYK